MANETEGKLAQDFDKVDAAIVAAENATDPIPCEKHGGEGEHGETCIRKAHGLGLNKKGKTLFWYGLDCDLPRKTFCSSCLAYWLLAVARNELIALRRAMGIGKAA